MHYNDSCIVMASTLFSVNSPAPTPVRYEELGGVSIPVWLDQLEEDEPDTSHPLRWPSTEWFHQTASQSHVWSDATWVHRLLHRALNILELPEAYPWMTVSTLREIFTPTWALHMAQHLHDDFPYAKMAYWWYKDHPEPDADFYSWRARWTHYLYTAAKDVAQWDIYCRTYLQWPQYYEDQPLRQLPRFVDVADAVGFLYTRLINWEPDADPAWRLLTTLPLQEAARYELVADFLFQAPPPSPSLGLDKWYARLSAWYGHPVDPLMYPTEHQVYRCRTNPISPDGHDHPLWRVQALLRLNDDPQVVWQILDDGVTTRPFVDSTFTDFS